MGDLNDDLNNKDVCHVLSEALSNTMPDGVPNGDGHHGALICSH